MVLAHVALGDPHVAAHNDERDAINSATAALGGKASSTHIHNIEYLKGVPAYVFGDSYTQYWPQGGIPVALLAKKHFMITPVNYGVSGTRCKDFFVRMEENWVPNTAGLVLIGCCLNNVGTYTDTIKGHTTSAETFRACLSYLSCRSIATLADGSNVVFGPGWTADGDGWAGDVGESIDIAWDSGELDVFCKFVTTTGGILEFRNEDDEVIKTGTTGDFEEDFTGVITVPSQGVGVHHIRATVTSGSVTIRKLGARAATPPKVVWDKPGLADHPDFPDAEVEADWTYLLAVAATYPNVIVSDSNVFGWDSVAMLSNDLAHRNSIGTDFAFKVLETTLRAEITGYEQGLNSIDTYTADVVYVTPTANYHKVGATAPSAPVLTAVQGNQVQLSWTRPNNNGNTIKGYYIQQSPAGAGTWTTTATVNTPATTRYTVNTGLTQGSSYDFRVRAFNDVGNGGFSNTGTATAGAPATFYGLDTFTRADDPLTPGTATTGGAWGADNANFGIKNNTLAMAAGSKVITTSRYAHCLLNTGQSQGFVEATLTKLDSVASGIILCANLAAAPSQGIVLLAIGGKYKFLAYNNISTSLIAVGTYAITPKVGDRIGIYHSGLNYYAVINGVVQTAFVGTTDYAHTRHGVIAWADGEWDDFQHSNIDPRV